MAVQNTTAAKTALPKEVFSVKVNSQAIFDTIMSDRASRRQGTHKVKNKAEVAGSGIKPWKQKGTGRARAGSKRSPIWVGGGRAFGPKAERNYTLTLNKKVRKLALASSLTLKAKAKAVVIEDFKLETISTKEVVKFIEGLKLTKLQRKVLIVTEDANAFRSAKNIQNVETVKINSISVEKVVNADVIVLSQDHINRLVEVIK
ncbi:50S ribosomal protein L4 [Mycoplasma marinum]|uniref:Large ribosomal subunit protein uL4 n=1 Tax=Mycoplasma marinum TaxID=1937190 RepID=A0A4R0XTP8_9MOLU|nr:50S ribosomal protein L4 [Mycoplasma marinum]TCG11147.1 50S ribosomal protein L4 [Mycoplasma marinum]